MPDVFPDTPPTPSRGVSPCQIANGLSNRRNSRLSFSYFIISLIDRFVYTFHYFPLVFGKIPCNINTRCYINIGADSDTVHPRL